MYDELFGQGRRNREEMDGDRRQGLVVGRLASIIAMRLRGKHRRLHAAHGLRRQRRRRQRRQGEVHRPQARPEDLLLAHRLPGRHQGAHRGRDPRRQVPRAHPGEGGGAHAAQGEPAGAQAADAPEHLQRRRTSPRGAEPRGCRLQAARTPRTSGANRPWPRPTASRPCKSLVHAPAPKARRP